MTALDFINLRAKKYATDPRISTALDGAAETFSATAWGRNLEKAKALLALHWLTMDDRDVSGEGIGGTLQSEQEGSLKRSYMIDFKCQSANPDWTQSRWGMELIQLRKQSIFAPVTRFSQIP